MYCGYANLDRSFASLDRSFALVVCVRVSVCVSLCVCPCLCVAGATGFVIYQRRSKDFKPLKFKETGVLDKKITVKAPDSSGTLSEDSANVFEARRKRLINGAIPKDIRKELESRKQELLKKKEIQEASKKSIAAAESTNINTTANEKEEKFSFNSFYKVIICCFLIKHSYI